MAIIIVRSRKSTRGSPIRRVHPCDNSKTAMSSRTSPMYTQHIECLCVEQLDFLCQALPFVLRKRSVASRCLALGLGHALVSSRVSISSWWILSHMLKRNVSHGKRKIVPEGGSNHWHSRRKQVICYAFDHRRLHCMREAGCDTKRVWDESKPERMWENDAKSWVNKDGI